MKKLTIIFLVAVLVPSAILAALALKAQEDQEYVIERQRALVHQGTVDALSDEVAAYLSAQQAAFRDTVDQLLAERGVQDVAASFDTGVRASWPLAEVGFVTSPGGGELVAPRAGSREQVSRFLKENQDFIAGNRQVQLFAWNAGDPGYAYGGVDEQIVAADGTDSFRDERAEGARLAVQKSFEKFRQASSKSGKAFYKPSEKKLVEADTLEGQQRPMGRSNAVSAAPDSPLPQRVEPGAPAPTSPPVLALNQQSKAEIAGEVLELLAENAPAAAPQKVRRKLPEPSAGPGAADSSGSRGVNAESTEGSDGEGSGIVAPVLRNTMPENRMFLKSAAPHPVSELNVRNELFGNIVTESPVGAVSRFVGEKLSVLFYYRPPAHPNFVFGAQVNLGLLREALADVVNVEFESPDEICVALLDDVGDVVARSLAGFDAEWTRPFVATEINEVLPRWEVAAYLVNPGAIGEVAKLARLRLGLTVLAVLTAIGVGGLLIFLDYRRQELVARQKTDFVSNVSHELKTPLTSIRMFSDLLQGESAADAGKRQRYAEVIQGEAGRLTRLINNVLDFSRLERGTREFERQETDLVRLVRETVEHYRPGLEKEGFSVELELMGDEAEVEADADALAQVMVNLLSNVEKYGGGERKEVRVEMAKAGGGRKVEVRVCDRGSGVDRAAERKIFERFFRAADSLNSGIQGSGLGLTLAKQIAQAHGGDVLYRPRDGGGSVFVLELPLITGAEERTQ